MPGNCPSTVAASEWQTPQASTRMRTCPGPGIETDLSTIRNLPGADTSTALYVSFMQFSFGRATLRQVRGGWNSCDEPISSSAFAEDFFESERHWVLVPKRDITNASARPLLR